LRDRRLQPRDHQEIGRLAPAPSIAQLLQSRLDALNAPATSSAPGAREKKNGPPSTCVTTARRFSLAGRLVPERPGRAGTVLRGGVLFVLLIFAGVKHHEPGARAGQRPAYEGAGDAHGPWPQAAKPRHASNWSPETLLLNGPRRPRSDVSSRRVIWAVDKPLDFRRSPTSLPRSHEVRLRRHGLPRSSAGIAALLGLVIGHVVPGVAISRASSASSLVLRGQRPNRARPSSSGAATCGAAWRWLRSRWPCPARGAGCCLASFRQLLGVKPRLPVHRDPDRPRVDRSST
jgi:hypothetical protein